MKLLLALSTIAVFGFGACGNSNTAVSLRRGVASTAVSSTSAPASKDSADKDADAESNDDQAIVDYGHLASTADMRVVIDAVRRYYAAAAAENGAKACSMLISTIAEGVPEEYGYPPGQGTPRGLTCAAAISKFFQRRHHQLLVKKATLRVVGVRVEADRALAILHFVGNAEPQKIPLHRQHGTWKMWELLDSKMP